MLECLKNFDWKKGGIFAAGVLFGTAGIKLLSSRDARKIYTQGTAAVLRAKECVMNTASVIQENAEDILAEAQQINEDRKAQEEAMEMEDASAEAREEDAEEEVKTAVRKSNIVRIMWESCGRGGCRDTVPQLFSPSNCEGK